MFQNYDIDVNRNPYSEREHGRTHKRPLSSGSILDNVFKDKNSSTEDLQPKTAIVHPVKRSQSFKEVHHGKGQLTLLKRSNTVHKGIGEKKSSVSNPSFEYTIGLIEESNNPSDASKSKKSASFNMPSRSNSAFSPRSRSTHSLSDDSCISSSEHTDSDDKTIEVVELLSKLTSKEREEILQKFIDVGDRILVTVAQRPPKYGRKMRKLSYCLI